MARIRTIKPEFFTSEDIVALAPSARLLYIALWCEADREGRLAWRPGTLKMRYMPGEQDDFATAAAELLERRLLVLYGDDAYCWIPTFLVHQRPNPREAKSIIPAPPVDNLNRDNPQLHAANLDLTCRREGKEGKGKEGKEASTSKPVDKVQEPEKPQAWWKSDAGIKAKGEELKVPTRPGESYAEYKARIFDHLQAQKAA